MFFLEQSEQQKQEYENYLKIAGSLSNLFSDSKVPFLYYRIAEKIFCKAFNANDLSRSDVSSDAEKDGLGLGLKTFLAGNNKTFQKIAEFNSDRPHYSNLSSEELIYKVSELRNARIEFTEAAHNLSKSIYHCVLREKNEFKVYEELMDKIDIPNIRNVKLNKNSIIFNDNKHEYSFLLSKSTLTKRFTISSIVYQFHVDILKDPLDKLKSIISATNLFETTKRIKDTVFLPLHGRNRTVFSKSGLNQWNAGGRQRDSNEVYIPIPIKIHEISPNFFPSRDTPFILHLPDGEKMKSKVCQEGSKALMSCSNKKLGEWILRKVLRLQKGELLTYEKLQIIGIDSVRIDKVNNLEYEINFAKIGSFENFIKGRYHP